MMTKSSVVRTTWICKDISEKDTTENLAIIPRDSQISLLWLEYGYHYILNIRVISCIIISKVNT